ncbi:MAG: PcfJ domain-containing protein [Panacagrimonas sp.]
MAEALEGAIQEGSKETRRRLKRMVRSIYVQPMVSVLSMKSGADGLTHTALWFRGVLDASAGEARKGILLSIGGSGAIAVSSAGRSTGSWPLHDVFLDHAGPASQPSSGTPRALVHELAGTLAARIVEAGAALFQSPDTVPAIVRNWAEHQARTAIAKWAEQLDEDSLDRARALEGPTLPNGTSIYNHLVRRLDESASPDARVFRNRGQFLASKSLLAEATLQDGFRGRGSSDYREIARAVDHGLSLRDTLSSLWSASPRTQTWLLSTREDWSGLFVQPPPNGDAPQRPMLPPEGLPQIVAAFEELPSEYWPHTPADLVEMHRLVYVESAGPGALARKIGIPLFDLLRNELKRGGWGGIGRAHASAERPLLQSVADALDAVHIIRQVLEWGIAHGPDREDINARSSDELLRTWLRSRPLASIFRLSDEVHGKLRTAEEEAQAELVATWTWKRADFPRLLPEQLWEIDGVLFEELSNLDSLREEGREMSHCVGTYGYDCVAGKLRVFRLSFGVERATLSIVIHSEHLALQQLRGFANSVVGHRIRAAAEQFLTGLNEGTIASDRNSVLAKLRSTTLQAAAEREHLYLRILNRRLDQSLQELIPSSRRRAFLATSLSHGWLGTATRQRFAR